MPVWIHTRGWLMSVSYTHLAFEASGCRADCEETYENFTSLRFTYTWKEIQARNGYIFHGLHNDDIPVELVTTTSSQNGAVCSRAEGDSGDITENIWYTGSRDSGEIQAETAGRKVQTLKASGISTPSDTERLLTPSNAGRIFTSSNAWKLFSMLLAEDVYKRQQIQSLTARKPSA